ncbi:MAG: hypothetical protein LBI89_02235, partial [Prevotellaceae bacterium]|nr:hypothetical protein [Prevotellaceae bacterium]
FFERRLPRCGKAPQTGNSQQEYVFFHNANFQFFNSSIPGSKVSIKSPDSTQLSILNFEG